MGPRRFFVMGQRRAACFNGPGRAKYVVPRERPIHGPAVGPARPGHGGDQVGRVGTGSKSCRVSGQTGGPYRLDIYTLDASVGA
jgi:hypothetical protein